MQINLIINVFSEHRWNLYVSFPKHPFAPPLSDLAMQLNQGKFEYNGSCG